MCKRWLLGGRPSAGGLFRRESGGTDEEEGGCAHSSAYITRSRCEQPVPSKLVSGDSGAGSGGECDGWVFDEDGGYGQDEAYELFQWAVE